MAAVKCIIEEVGVDIDQAAPRGYTPFMAAAIGKHRKVAKWLLNYGADAQASDDEHGTAVDVSKEFGSPELTAYLEARARCGNPNCGSSGLKMCAGCKQARYCGPKCQHMQW